MKKIFIDKLIRATRKNKNIVLIVNDLGFNMIEPFANKYPKNIFNAGVSEQSMIGYAAGLAASGKKVFVYSIGNFSTFRCAEQIRNDVDYHKLNVTIVSVGAGVGYGKLGYSHHSIQDYALMRTLPNMEIVSPSSNQELINSMQYIIKKPGPKYLRLDKTSIDTDLNIKKQSFKPGKWVLIKKGKLNKTILLTGSCLDKALSLIKQKKYKDYYMYSIPIWSMKSKNNQSNFLKNFSEILVIENHLEDGGFSSWLKEAKGIGMKIKIQSISLSDKIVGKVGDQKFLEKKYFNLLK